MRLGLEQLQQHGDSLLRASATAACRCWHQFKLPSIDLSAWHPADEPPVFSEVKALLKASTLVLAGAALLAALSCISTGTTRDIAAVVVSEISVGFSKTSRHVIAQLQNGDKVEVRLRTNTILAMGQTIQITERTSMIDDMPSYSYLTPTDK
jgi:hypothetical protein